MAEATTPSGIHIAFDERKHAYLVNGEPVPTVTQVLKVLDKPALPWWGMKVGCEGVVELAKRYGWKEDGWPEFDADDLVNWLKREKLTVNHIRNQAGDRGKYVHQALEFVAENGEPPDYRTFPVEGRGYVKAIGDWWSANALAVHETECLVASQKYGFAGTYDLRCTLDQEPEGVRIARVDCKTSKAIYPEMFLQLEAYELAAVECGYGSSDVRMVLRVAADGTWEAKESFGTGEQFLGVLAAYKALQELRLNAADARAAA